MLDELEKLITIFKTEEVEKSYIVRALVCFKVEFVQLSFHYFIPFQNVWIRQGAVGFVSTVARKMDVADIHCHMVPTLAPFLKHPVIQIDQEVCIIRYSGRFFNLCHCIVSSRIQ